MSIMPIEGIDDWESRLRRQDAFWEGHVLDRPVACITLPAGDGRAGPSAGRAWHDPRARWWDIEHTVECAHAQTSGQRYLGDSLPHFWPNLGPEVFSAFFGTELQYGETTTWSVPNLRDWDDVGDVRFSWDNEYIRQIDAMTDALLEAGRGRFYTGMTDLHPGGDAVAAFRDPANLAVDMLECPERVVRLMEYVTDVFFEVYDHFADKLQNAGQALSSWPGLVSGKRWYAPSNDFSCMISNTMFRDVFLPVLARECAHLEASIYHLDGPGALQHLDSLLELEDLNAIQWVFGAGNGPMTRWIDVYQRCQRAGKGLQITLGPDEDELDWLMEHLRPEGIWLGFYGVKDTETAQSILRKLCRWKG